MWLETTSGKNALAAVGMTSSLTFFYFALCNGFATGAGVLMSQYFGMKNEKRVKDALGNSIYLMLGMGILVSIISVLLAEPTLRLLNTPESRSLTMRFCTRVSCAAACWQSFCITGFQRCCARSEILLRR